MPDKSYELLLIEMKELRQEMHRRFDSLNRRIIGGSAVLVAIIIGNNAL